MTKTIKLETTDEKIKDIETVSLRFTGALIEGGEALEDQFRIPNVRFEIRLKTGQVINAMAGESGKFTTEAIEFKIPQGVLQSTAYRVLHVLVDVQANDGIKTMMKTVKLDVARLLEQHRNYKTLIEVKNNLEKEKRREEEARRVEAGKRAEEARKAESARKIEATKKAEEARKTEIKTAAVIEVELTKAIGVINGYGDREPRKAFEVLVEHFDHPSINGYLNKINFQGTGVVVDYYPIYKNTKWAISLAKRAITERLSKGCSLNIHPFLYEGWFPEFFIHLAEKYPKEILKWFVELSHFDFVEKAAILIAQKESDLILGIECELKDIPWGKRIIYLAKAALDLVPKPIRKLKTRFRQNAHLHEGLDWNRVQSALEANPKALRSVDQMETQLHEPDVYNFDDRGFDIGTCQKERLLFGIDCVYDSEAAALLKELNPEADFSGSAVENAELMGISLMSPSQFKMLPEEFVTRAESWLLTDKATRMAGDALYGGRDEYGVNVFRENAYYHCLRRTWRGSLRVPWA